LPCAQWGSRLSNNSPNRQSLPSEAQSRECVHSSICATTSRAARDATASRGPADTI
jgi:hypothetical protein